MDSGRTTGTRSQAIRIAARHGALTMATAGWPLLARAAEPAERESGLSIGLLLMALAAVLAATAWQLWRTRSELADARQHLQRLADLLDVWHWHSDAGHRLVALRPPAGAPPAAWSAVELNQPLWEVFRSDDEAAFRARLDSQAPLDDVPALHRAPGADAPVAMRLRARVLNDREGRFAGYVGTLREPAPATVAVVVPGSANPAAGMPAPDAPNTLPAAADSMPLSLEPDHESFGYTVSHDLRAPIRVVEGFTRILKEDYGRLLDRIGNDHLDRVLGAAARMNAMIDALLALSKLSSQPVARQPVNLTQLAQYVIEDLRRQSPQREVQFHLTPGLQALGDPTLLRVVLENLLGNAWKYSAKRADAQIWFERSGHENAMFCVRDNGAGFDMRFADRLFGVFQRLHSANDFQGTGVGLASVRRIIRRHGGEIWAEAEVGRGASFHFSLPVPARG
ncbi:MAG: ATP-binding protein [Burkholderiaceae bacterium]